MIEITVDQVPLYLEANGKTTGRVTVETARRWCRSGRLKARKLPGTRGQGGEWAVELEDLAAFEPPNRGRRGRPRKENDER